MNGEPVSPLRIVRHFARLLPGLQARGRSPRDDKSASARGPRRASFGWMSLAVVVGLIASLVGPAMPVFAANPSANLDDCANGKLNGTPADCSASGDWVNGDLVASK